MAAVAGGPRRGGGRAKRLNLAPSILLVVAGVGMALVPGSAEHPAGAGTGAAGLPAAVDLFGRRRDELARIQVQPAADRAACLRLRGVHAPAPSAAAAHYLLGFDWAVGFLLGAIVAPPDVVAPLAIARRLGLPRQSRRHPGRRRSRQRRDRADPLSLRGGRRAPPAPSRSVQAAGNIRH